MDPGFLKDAAPAAPWSLLVGQIGTVAVLVALSLYVLSVLFGIMGGKSAQLQKFSNWSFQVGCLGLFVAMGCVMALFVKDQFQYKYVFGHGSVDSELQYKIAGTWSGQEGSFLLWAVASALFGLIAAPFTRENRRVFTIVFAGFLAAVAGILAYESPFALNPLVDGKILVPIDGQGLNPTLMNYWVVIHPPTIFLGFGSLTVLFAWAVAALVNRDLVSWAQPVRPWTMVSLTFLGLGLAMGGFWAYETLGWGGFWMWDPVENTSFVPWVGVAALVHGLFVQVSRQKWHMTNALLAGLPFILFCYGTFLTRSGFLADTSVHSFAEMNRSALWILIGMVSFTFLGFIVLWAVRGVQRMQADKPSRVMERLPINRETLMSLAIWLLVGFAIVTAIGMSVPFIQTVSGQKPKVVEERLYNTVLSFLWLPLVVAMAIGPFVTWRGLSARQLFVRFVNVFAIATGVVGFMLLWLKSDFFGIPADLDATTKLLLNVEVNRVGWVLTLVWFSVFGISASIWKIWDSGKRNRSAIGGMLTHLGVGVALLGLIVSRGLERKQEAFVLSTANSTKAFGYQFKAVKPTSSFVDRRNKIEVAVTSPRGEKFTVAPGLYFRGMNESGEPIPFIWPAIHGRGMYDLYLVLHNITFDASGQTQMKVGDQRLLEEEQMLITYNGMKSEGPLGQVGASFKADVTVHKDGKTFNVQPMMKMTEAGMENVPGRIGDGYAISLLGIDAADKSAKLQVKYTEPAYVSELFYKPLTLFVWLGIGIMTFGGGLTAWTRRRVAVASESKDTEPEPEREPTGRDKRHATEPVAQS